MCGIAGYIGSVNWDASDVISLISHRGPDSNGYFTEDQVGLAHTRLSIQDLSENGSQPMFSADGRYVIIFNGEIYNHLEVRNHFSGEFNFRSTGDTETVLNAYIKYGPACLDMLNGIFALAIYDRKEKELFIARDQIGVKPLYFYNDDNRIIFSSELKTLLLFDIDRTLQPKAFMNYLAFLWSPGEMTPFERVRKLLPGHYIKLRPSEITVAKPVLYYQPKFDGTYLAMSEEHLINLLDNHLQNAVKRQMLSDVPVGFFLSGGLDSSLIVAIARKLFPEMEFPCFTIDIDSGGKVVEGFADDLSYAHKVAAYLKVNLNVVKADIDIVKDFDKMIWHLDEPQSDAAPLNVLNIATLARKKGIKVLLGGAGGDDIFSGYRRHQALRYEKNIQNIPLAIRKIFQSLDKMIPSNKPFFRRVKKILSSIDKSPVERQAAYFGWLPTEVVKSLFAQEWRSKLEQYDPYNYFYELEKHLPVKSHELTRMLYWEVKTFLVDHNLNYTDKMAMAVGVEVRVPFLDLELVEFSKSIPPELKMKGKETKYILKRVAERYLPMDVIYRPKTGFGAPVRKWITNDLKPMIEERLSDECLEKWGIFDSKKVWELIEANQTGRIDASYSIWSLLAIESWLAQFVDADK